jgi:hypothetical protein
MQVIHRHSEITLHVYSISFSGKINTNVTIFFSFDFHLGFTGSCFTLVLETTIKFYGIFVRDDSTNLTIKINFGKI